MEKITKSEREKRERAKEISLQVFDDQLVFKHRFTASDKFPYVASE